MDLAVSYYPEQWPRERWETDARLMKEAGISLVRMGEFSWSRLEPREGAFDCEWLQEAVRLLGSHGIKSILCTPTPTYPPWLHRKYPDLHQIKSNGQIKEFGQRQDACKNHPGYRRHALRITEKLTRSLGKHPDVVAWQTDNELGCHGTTRCYCDYCQRAFQRWLRDRYGNDIAALNRAWGTSFWSQDYTSFAEISPPRDTADREGRAGQNPGLSLAFYRFSSDVQVAFQRDLIDIIRSYSPGRIVTHNLMGGYTQIDYFDLSRDLDLVSWTNYPFFELKGRNLPPSSLRHALMRGLKKRNVWVMEQAAGPGGWDTFAPNLEPGLMRLWAYQAIARGTDLVNFFRWRSARFGMEQYWHGILHHHGVPQRRYEELKQLSEEMRKISQELAETAVRSEVALLFDYPSLWSLEIQPHVEKGFGYWEMAERLATVLAGMGVQIDVVRAGEDLSPYKIVLAPSQHICSKQTAESLERFVKAGGTLILGPRSGVKDEHNAVVEAFLPGCLRALAGCSVEDYDAFSVVPGFTMQVRDAVGNEYQALGLAEVLVPEENARSILSYTRRFYAGRSAAVENPCGSGRCLYLGTVLGEDGLEALLGRVFEESGIFHQKRLPQALEVAFRERDGQRYRFYLNHGTAQVSLAAIRAGTDLLSGQAVGDEIRIPGLDLMIVKER